MVTHTQFYWPIIGGKAFIEATGEIVSLDAALDMGLNLISARERKAERGHEIEGNSTVALNVAQHGYCIDYDFKAPPRKFKAKAKAATPALRKPIVASPVASKQEPEPEPLSAFGRALMNLDEAKARPQAARLLLDLHTEDSLPLHQAAAMLGALPIEHHNIEVKMTEYRDPKTEAIVARAAELRQGMLSTKGAKGDANARAEAIKLGSALTAHRAGKPIAAALHESGVDIAAVAALAKTAHR